MKISVESQSKGALALLLTQRFGPFFWTQFFGAMNDNLFKTALAVLLTYGALSGSHPHSAIWVNLAAGLFIAPFFLFSALAGQLADKFEKSALISRIKAAEVMIMGAAALAWIMNWPVVLLLLLFAMGTQSAFFGPVKYSLIPQHLSATEVVAGNGLVEMGTFLAILAGTILGGILIAVPSGRLWVALSLAVVAGMGWWLSRRIPTAEAADPKLKMQWNIWSETRRILHFARKDHYVFLAILANSWFWFIGASYLTQLPAFARDILHCRPEAISLLLALFAIGIALGSVLCQRLSGSRVELGLVPLGSLGMAFFGWDLVRAAQLDSPETAHSMLQFMALPGTLRILADLALIGFFGGLYIVPLFAYIQMQTPRRTRSRIIAAANIFNALFMVASAVTGALLPGLAQMPLPHFFGLLALLNLIISLLICYRVPYVAFRSLAWILTHTFYRIRYKDIARIPSDGPAVLVCNHVSYVDALIIFSAAYRPVRFVMHARYYRIPIFGRFLAAAGGIPIDSGRKSPALLNRAFREIARTLKKGGLVCIFPEGKLTRDGQIDTFRPGIEKIVALTRAPVIPMALKGLWGSFFSHQNGPPMNRLPRRFWSKIELAVGCRVAPQRVSAEYLRSRVQDLRGAWA